MLSQSGVKALEEKFYNLPEQLQRNRETLTEVGKGVKLDCKLMQRG